MNNRNDDRINELQAENDRLRAAIMWALGCEDEFRARYKHEGAYWWRTELRERSGIAREALKK